MSNSQEISMAYWLLRQQTAIVDALLSNHDDARTGLAGLTAELAESKSIACTAECLSNLVISELGNYHDSHLVEALGTSILALDWPLIVELLSAERKRVRAATSYKQN